MIISAVNLVYEIERRSFPLQRELIRTTFSATSSGSAKSDDHTSGGTAPSTQPSSGSSTKKISPAPSCIPKEQLVFSKDITDLSRISQITPPGFTVQNGDLKTHSYLWIGDGKEVPIYAPADARLVAGAHYSESGMSQYHLLFEVACDTEFKFDHFLNPIDDIKKVFSSQTQTDTRTSPPTAALVFKAGDLLGYTSGTPQAHNWDFGLYYRAQTNSKYTGNQKAYGSDHYAICPYEFFPQDKKSAYVALFNRAQFPSDPIGGLCK